MKLSMWILADALKSFDPEIEITEGACVLQGARICSDTINISKSAVYISENSTGQVVLANGHDIISVRHDDPLDILNVVLDVFEKCNEWEIKMSEAIHRGCSIHEMLQLSHELLPHYLIIADAAFLMRASYGSSEAFVNEVNFQLSSENHRLPLDSLIAINKQTNIRKEGIGAYRVTIPNSSIDTSARNLFVSGKHIGWLVVLKGSGQFTQGEMQLINEIGYHAEQFQKQAIACEDDLSKSSFLLDILEGRDYDPLSVSEQLGAFGWFERDQKQVYVFLEPKSENEHFLIGSQLSEFSKNTFQMIYHDTFVLIADHSLTDIDLLERSILNYLKISRGNVGRSAPFENIFQLKTYVDTARIASQFSRTQGKIVDFSQVTLPYICSIIRDYSLADINHPALNILSEYDRKHDTELYDTLRIFVENERNYTAVSRLLNIHRSTLIYRLERIEELTGSSFSEADERLHLLISFKLNAARQL